MDNCIHSIRVADYCMQCGTGPRHGTVLPETGTYIKKYLPFVCPKCAGEGTDNASKRFLNPTQPNCWPCNGTGILWQ